MSRTFRRTKEADLILINKRGHFEDEEDFLDYLRYKNKELSYFFRDKKLRYTYLPKKNRAWYRNKKRYILLKEFLKDIDRSDKYKYYEDKKLYEYLYNSKVEDIKSRLLMKIQN